MSNEHPSRRNPYLKFESTLRVYEHRKDGGLADHPGGQLWIEGEVLQDECFDELDPDLAFLEDPSIPSERRFSRREAAARAAKKAAIALGIVTTAAAISGISYQMGVNSEKDKIPASWTYTVTEEDTKLKGNELYVKIFKDAVASTGYSEEFIESYIEHGTVINRTAQYDTDVKGIFRATWDLRADDELYFEEPDNFRW